MSELKLDRSQWRTFTQLLNKTKDQVRLRAFFPKGHPLKDQDRGKKSHADLAWITKCQEDGRGVYVVVNNGGDTDASITDCKAFFCEWDDREKYWQINAWQELGLPKPSLQIDTGGKSIHNYWILKKAIDPKTWKPIQERLLDHADADRALKNPSRVMRLPGTHHMNTDGSPGELTTIIDNSGINYTLKDIESCLPTPKVAEQIKRSSEYKDYRKESIEVVEEALRCIPSRTPGSNTYHMYRNILWGLIKACEDAGRDSNYAVSLMESHSPSWKGLDQIANSGGKDITAGTFWYWAIKNGYVPRRNVTVLPPKFFNTQNNNDDNDDDNENNNNNNNNEEGIQRGGERLQRLEAHDLLRELRSYPKKDKEGGVFRYNIFTQQIEFGGQVCQGKASPERFYLALALQGFKISKDLAFDCLVQTARENEYDPVREYLERCRDKEPPMSIDRLASTYLRPEDAALPEATIYDQMIKCTMIAAVARVFEPGCKFDNACILMGPQGARKSSWWKAMGGDFFSDALKDISTKDSLMILHRSWIMEMSEIDQVHSKKHSGEIKAFLSQSTDMFRVPYGKVTEDFPRRGIIVGSTNRHDGFLLDETGSRRFWVIETTCTIENQINVEGLLKEIDSLWAAAVHCYENDEPYQLPIETELEINENNEKYLIDNPWKNIISEYVNSPSNFDREFTTNGILTEVIEKPLERQTRYDQMQVATILKDLGLAKKRRGAKSSRKWVYLRESHGVLTSAQEAYRLDEVATHSYEEI